MDLDDVELDPVFALRREGQPTLYLFEYVRERTGPTGSVAQRVMNCLLRADDAFAPLAFRAHPQRNRVMESLEASRTGSSRIELEAPCDIALSVFAREPDLAADALRGAVCRILARAVVERGADAVVVGERHILTHVTTDSGQDAEPKLEARLETLEALASDVLALYAALGAKRSRR